MEPPSWQPPTGGVPPPPPPPYGAPPGGLPQYGAPQYGAPPPPYGAPGYATPGYGNPTYLQPYPAYVAIAPKPGIIPLRPLAVGEILDGAFATIRRHPKAVLGLAAAVACVQQALILLVRVASGTLTQTASFANDSQNNAGAIYSALGSYFVAALAGALLTGMLCLIVSDSVLGQATSVHSAWSRLRPLIGRLLAVTVLATLAEYAGLALCLAPGIFLWGIWALVVPALVLERTTFTGAFRRSRTLVRGSFWRVWGIRALGYLIAGFLNGIVGAAAGASTLNDVFSHPDQTAVVHISTLTIVLTAVLTIVATTLTAPFLSGVNTLLYVDRRIRVEALDVQLQQAAASAVPTFG